MTALGNVNTNNYEHNPSRIAFFSMIRNQYKLKKNSQKVPFEPFGDKRVIHTLKHCFQRYTKYSTIKTKNLESCLNY